MRPGYKQTEVGVIPEDWAVTRIDSVISEISMGPFGSDIKVSNFVAEGIPVLSGLNVRNERLTDSFANFVTHAKARSLKKAVARRGDIVITHRGTLGQISYIPEDSVFDRYVISQSQFRVRFNENQATPNWIVLFFHSERGARNLLEGKGHTGVPAIAQPTKTFRQLFIPLPSKTEQEAIAEALSDADALIESLEQLIAKKRQIKQGAMQELLTGKKRLPGFVGEWEVKLLGDVLMIAHGKSQHDVADQNGIYPILATGGQIGKAKHFLYDKPSVLIGRKGTIDQPQFMDAPFWSVDTLFYSVVHEPNSAKFLYYKFCLIDWKQYNEASGVPSLNARTIEAIEIRIPQHQEQIAIATILSDMDAELAALETRLAKARQLKQGMMQELLTGRIRLVNPTSTVIAFPARKASASTATRPHNWQINEAVIIAVLAKHFGSEEWPLARKRCTKLTYLLHRHIERQAEGYLKKAAGPYNPAMRYKGPEGIAQKNGYARVCDNGKYEGFVGGEKITEAESYFDKWYGAEVLAWLEQFRFKKTDELELLATVDMAAVDLRQENRLVNLDSVKQVIQGHPEWRAKLTRDIFSDANIFRAIQECEDTFG